jgi:hypothetical protein
MIITRSREGARVSFSGQEITLLESWVRKGNTLVLLGALTQWDDTRDLLRQFGFSLPVETGVSSISDFFHPLEPSSISDIPVADELGAGTLVMPSAAPLPTTYDAHAQVLAQRSGQPYLISEPYGNGRVICGASARIISNSFLDRGRNLPVVLQLLARGGKTPRRLFFEETHHGFSTIFALARLLEHPGVRFGGMLALLGLLTFVGSSLIRFGPIIPVQRAEGRSTLEFVNSIADLYQRADLRNDMIAYLFRETHQRILHRLHLPPTAPHALIASRLQEAYPQLPKWKKLAQRFDSNDYVVGLPPSGWLRVARELIEIKSAMA